MSGFIFSSDFGKTLLVGISQFLTVVRGILSWGQEHLLLRIIGAALIFAFFLLLKSLIAKVILKNIEWFILKHQPKIKQKILAEIERPISFIPVILGIYVSLEYLMPDMDLKYKVPLFLSLGSISFFWIIYNLIHPIAYFFNKVAKLNTAIMEWIVRLIRLTLVLVGLASVLEMWGIQIAPIIAGLGLFGMAVALGAQDMFKNILAGLAIVSEKRFKVGEFIRLNNDVEGIVEHIGFRSTLIRRFDKAPIYVPNADLADAAVVNFSERNNRRISWKVGLEYRTTANQLRYIRNEVEAFVLRDNAYSRPPESPIQVRLDSFGESSVTLMIYCFTATKGWEDYLRAKEKLVLCVKEVVEAAGAAFAFPSQSLYIEQLLEDRSLRGKVKAPYLTKSEEVAKKNKSKLKDVGPIGEDY